MSERCVLCAPESSDTSGDLSLCPACAARFSTSTGVAALRRLLDAIEAPVLLMQSNPRQVVTANRKALELFGKDLTKVEGHRGGEVFDCRHSLTEPGCGLDANCEHCEIKAGVVDTFVLERSRIGVRTQLDVIKGNETCVYRIGVSTTRAGCFALLRIDQFEKAS